MTPEATKTRAALIALLKTSEEFKSDPGRVDREFDLRIEIFDDGKFRLRPGIC